jgi:hypothetical protein
MPLVLSPYSTYFVACCQAIFFRRCVVEEAVTSAIDAQAGAIVAAHNEAEIQAGLYSEYHLSHFFGRFAQLLAVQSLLTDEYLSTWLSESILSISDWGTADDSRNPPPPPPPVVSSTTWGNAGGVGGTGGWGMGGGWGAGGGWNNVGNGWGNLGGGWDDGEWTPRRRWFPSHRGIRRMGAVFRTGALFVYPPRCRKVTWLRRVERRWRRVRHAISCISE